MDAIGLLFALPLMILNLLGGLIGGIGLAVQGEWRLLLGGIGYMVAGPFILSIAMIPAMIFLPLSAWAANRENTAMVVIAAIPNLAWTYLVVAVSCVVVFSWVVSGQEGGFFQILWGYSVATAPWSFMAQKDRQSGNETSTTLMFFVQLGTISMMVATFLDPSDVDPSRLMVWFLPFFVLGLIAQLFIAWVETRGRRTLGY